ncbi:MAG TPA: ATP-binding cassette domain-containing protein, partial [Acidobacteriota bacterium]|nr:ATP-binding cassette domain-containing protein [Acidobacteriota bacterium]
QRFNLFPTLSVEGNLKLAERIRQKGSQNEAPAQEYRRHILQLLSLENRLHHKPIELSGGEQQRVALARAIVNHPAILLADEPTGNLDSENSQIVLDMLVKLNKELGQTVLMITHNLEAAQTANRLVTMRDGRILHDVPVQKSALSAVEPGVLAGK